MFGRLSFMCLLGLAPIVGGSCACRSSAADETKTVKKATLGAETRVPSADDVKLYQLIRLVGKVQGQCVTAMDKSGPAAKAGLKAGDILLALDANRIFSRDDIEDFLRVSQPGAKVQAVVKRAGTFKEELIGVTLGETKVASANQQFTWQYAGLGQLDAALAAANKHRRLVLVGLSGADT